MKDNPTDAGKLKYLCDYYVYDERYSALNRMIYLTNHDVNGNHGDSGKLSSMYGTFLLYYILLSMECLLYIMDKK